MDSSPLPSAAPVRPSWLTRVARLTRKELRETLRDRRTIVTLLVMPLVLYPLLGVVFQQFLLLSKPPSAEAFWNIGVNADSAQESETGDPIDLQRLVRLLRAGDRWLERQRETKSAAPLTSPNPLAIMPAAPSAEPSLDRLRMMAVPSPEQAVRNGQVDVGVWIRPRAAAAQDGEKQRLSPPPLDFELVFLPQSGYGREAARFIESRLRAANDVHFRTRLAELGESAEAPSEWKLVALKTEEDESFQLAALIPLILILMTITGAVYPAIDLTAGERERGTLEALMAAPTPRLGLLFAKYVAVLCVALLTAVFNTLAMSLTIWSTGMGAVLFGERGISLAAVSSVFALMLLFAGFFSAVLLTVTSFARSFKEAQAYLIPLVLVSLTPGFMSLLPGVKLNSLLAVTPLANIVLLARDVLQGQASPLLAATAVISTVLYAVAALSLAARIFGSDAVLYGSQESWGDLFRRPSELLTQPTVAGAATAVAVVYPLYFVLNGFLGLFREHPVAWQLSLASFGTVVIFAVIPYFLARAQGLRVASAWGLARPGRFTIWIGALLLGVGLWPLAYEFIVVLQQVGLSSLSLDDVKHLAPGVDQVIANWKQSAPAWLVWLAIAAAPGVCEELFFRGYLLNSLRGRVPAAAAIAISALIFGLFHLSVGGLAAVERVFTSAFLGVVLGYLFWRTGSVWPGVLVHILHNSTSVALALFSDQLKGSWLEHSGETHLAWQILLPSVMLCACGLWIVSLGTRPDESKTAF